MAPTPGSPRSSRQSSAQPCPEGRPLPKGWHQLAWKKVAPGQTAKGGRNGAPGGARESSQPRPRGARPPRVPARLGHPGGAGSGLRTARPGPSRPAGASASPRSPAPASRSRSGRRSWPPPPGTGRPHGRHPPPLRPPPPAAPPPSPPPPGPRAAPRGPGASEPPRRRLLRPPALLTQRQPPREEGEEEPRSVPGRSRRRAGLGPRHEVPGPRAAPGPRARGCRGPDRRITALPAGGGSASPTRSKSPNPAIP